MNDFSTSFYNFITASTRSFLVYTDHPKNINGVENKAGEIPTSVKTTTSNYSTPSVEPVSISINISEEEQDQPVKSAYHSFYVYPRSQGNKSNSPNLLWHELKTQG